MQVVGLRLNQRPPNVYFKRKNTGGIAISSTCQLVNITELDVQQLLHEYRIHSAEVRCPRRVAYGGGARPDWAVTIQLRSIPGLAAAPDACDA